MTAIYFLRHGQTDYNVSNRWMGLVDIFLNEAGEQQVYALLPSLKELSITEIYTSPLARAKRTSEIIAHNLEKISLHVISELKERDIGDFEGFKKTGENRKLLEKSLSVEPIEDVALRVKRALELITGRNNTSLIVSHSAVYRCIINELRYISSSSSRSISNGEVVKLHWKNDSGQNISNFSSLCQMSNLPL